MPDPKTAFDPETGEIRDSDIGLYTEDGIVFTSEVENETLRHLIAQGKGDLLAAVSVGIKEILNAMNDQDIPQGAISISLSYHRGTDNEIRCKSKVTTKIPVRESESIYFATPNGSLSRHRPDELNFKRRD